MRVVLLAAATAFGRPLPGDNVAIDPFEGWFSRRSEILFVHIPKTGGTAVAQRLHRLCRSVSGSGHENTVANAHARSLPAIVTLRDPYARLHSAFEYWAKGSDLHPRGGAPSELRFEAFLAAVVNSSSPSHLRAMSLLYGTNDENPYVVKEHFEPQAKWFKGFDPNTDVRICYCEDQPRRILGKTVRALLAAGYDCDAGKARREAAVNPTTRKRPFPATVSGDFHEVVRAFYGSDLLAFRSACGACAAHS